MELPASHQEVSVNLKLHKQLLNLKCFVSILGRINSSQDDLDDDSIQGKQVAFDNFSMFSSE